MAGDSYIIIMNQELPELQREVGKLRAELAELLQDRDALLLHECPEIEAQWLTEAGGLEYEAYELECRMRRLKREKELIQAAKNRSEKPDREAIKQRLDAEFEQYQAKLRQKQDELEKAAAFARLEKLSKEDTAEIKKLYHDAVKSLHPDLHPDLSEEDLRLFKSAVTAYQNGDLTMLRVISAAVAGAKVPDENDAGLLLKEQGRLIELIKQLRGEIAAVKADYPYKMITLLSDAPRLAEYKEILSARIASLKEACERLGKQAEEMLGGEAEK